VCARARVRACTRIPGPAGVCAHASICVTVACLLVCPWAGVHALVLAQRRYQGVTVVADFKELTIGAAQAVEFW
jgi:hypothetical protein